MPVNQQADFALNGQWYMLYRDPRGRGRAWVRQRVPDTLSQQRRLYRSIGQDEIYGGLPDELDHPEIFADWSGGYGVYQRVQGKENHYHLGFNVDTRFPRQAFLAQRPQLLPARYAGANINIDFVVDVPLSGVNTAPVGAGTVLLLGNGAVQSLTPTNLPYTSGSAFDFALESNSEAGVGHRPALFGSFVYMPNLLGSGFIQRTLNGQTLTQGSLPATCFAVANGRLWRAHSKNLLQSCAVGSDPMTATNWSATLSIGNGTATIADLQAFEEHIFAGLADGLYMGDQAGSFVNVATDIGQTVNADSVRDLSVHNGGVVFAEGPRVWWFKPSSGANSELRQIWPVVDARTVSSFSATQPGMGMAGRVTCLKGSGRWLYAGVFNGSQSQVFCGYDASGAPLPYVWHPMQLFAETCKVSRIHVDNITTSSGNVGIPRRIWAVTDASFGAQAGCTAPLYFWPVPQGDEVPFADPSFSPNYCLQGYIEESLTDSEAPAVWKTWRKVEVWSEGLGGAGASDVAASTSLAIDAYLDATMKASFDSTTYAAKPKDYHYFQDTNNDATALSAQFGLRLNGGFAQTGSSTPVLRAVVAHNVFRPRIAEVVTAKVRIADGIRDRQGGEMRPGAGMLTELETLSKASSPVQLVDLVGRSIPVVVLPGIDEEEAYQGASDYPEVVATARIGIVDASWSVPAGAPFHPDGG